MPLSPTPHPLATAYGALLSLFGSDTAMWLWQGTGLLALVALGVLVATLGARWFGLGAGLLAAAIVLTREPVLSFGLRAYLDLPYVCLLLGALLVLRRPPVALSLITLAGLLRPEAWLFAAAYGAWLWRRGELRPGLIALAAAAPVLWALHDLALTGDPLWSLTGTQENAGTLQRVTGLDDLPATLPRRLGEILREPVLVAAAGGIVLTWLWCRRARGCSRSPRAPVALGRLRRPGRRGPAAADALPPAAGGDPGDLRGAGALGWARLARTTRAAGRGWRSARSSASCCWRSPPRRPAGSTALSGALDRQAEILERPARGRDRPGARRCRPITLANRRGDPPGARCGRASAPSDVVSAQDAPVRGTYVAPASPRVARDFVLDRRDRDQRIAAPPAAAPSRRVGAWTVSELCGWGPGTPP